MPKFRHLRSKLAVLYAGLFGAILLLIAVLALAAVSENAQHVVRRELATSSLVFQRVWAQRAAQLETDGLLLSRDFGFKTAVATGDAATIRSALANLKQRLEIDRAMIIAADGRVISADDEAVALAPAALRAMQGDDVVSGILTIAGWPYEAVSTPIEPGANLGWVVFAAKLDRRPMSALESMAAIPLNASLAFRVSASAWRDDSMAPGRVAGAAFTRFLNTAIAKQGAPPVTLPGPHGVAMAVATPLNALDPERPAVLVLQYPIAKAMAPYRMLLGLLVATGAAGFAALVVGTWMLARSVTRPISSLAEAARRLQRGERVTVEVETHDEIGRLAESFNAMAAEIHQREGELEAARDLAEAANRAKSSLLTNMSHEVRTPLNGVIGIAGLLSQTQMDARQRQMVGIIQSSASVLQRILDDLLDLARVEAGRTQIIEDDFDLGRLMDSIAGAARVQCQAKGLAFELIMDEAELGLRTGDRVRLEQILGNLIGNAVKFTDAGSVALSVEVDGAEVRFDLRDTGVGFEPASAEQLFEAFHQLDGSITSKHGGAGLGLSISRDLARAMGGDITATAVPGRGAVFTLRLPLAMAAAHPVADAPSPEPVEASEADKAERAVRVLVVDDHETNRTVARMILEGVGVETVCVEDGAQAVSATEHECFDVVFMDMQMPIMDGLTAIRRIRERELGQGARRTPILMLSANAMPEHVDAAHAAGADGHVAKPITPPRLIAAVQHALTLADAGDERQAAS